MSRIAVLTKTERYLVFKEVIPKHYIVPIHRHNNKESFHIAKGCGHIYTNGKLQEVRKGMKIDICPGIDHGLFTKREPLECLVVIQGEDRHEITKIFWDLMKKHKCL
jgi:quercetin dioxygenase-like cupin family protein